MDNSEKQKIETGFEHLVLIWSRPLIFLGAVGILFSVIVILSLSFEKGLPVFLFFFSVFCISLWLNVTSETFQVFNPESGFLEVKTSFFGFKKSTPVLRLNEIKMVSVKGTVIHSRFAIAWSYRPVLILDNGDIFPFGNEYYKKPDKANSFARKVAKSLKVDFKASPAEKTLKLSENEITFSDWSGKETIKNDFMGALLALSIIFGLIAGIIGLTIFLSK